MPAKKDTQPTFEQAIQKLESIIDRVETGEIGLEESLKAYEDGAKLIARCRTILKSVESRINQLVVDDKGELQSTDAPEVHDPSAAEHSALEGEIDEEDS